MDVFFLNISSILVDFFAKIKAQDKKAPSWNFFI